MLAVPTSLDPSSSLLKNQTSLDRIQTRTLDVVRYRISAHSEAPWLGSAT
jgi:hypothetical protein